MKVLIADDDPSSRLILERALTRRGYEVMIANDGLAALRVLESNAAPSLVILDWMMPGMDGPEICRRVRARDDANAGYTYVVMLTSRSDHEDVVAGLTAGADDYVVKPFAMPELEARLRVGRRILELESRLRADRAEYERRSQHDVLTGIWNRRAILEGLERELARGVRENRCVALVMFDLDRFKSINDTHGHPVGDEVLSEAARRLQQELRPYDLLGRLGGEEFLAVINCRDTEEAVMLAERLRRAIETPAIATSVGPLTVTTSCGVATSEMQGHVSQGLLAAVDQALYRAKRCGRNRVEADRGLPAPPLTSG